jgi:hypothetical protein
MLVAYHPEENIFVDVIDVAPVHQISSTFPTTPGAFDTSYNSAIRDGFVTKLNPSGTALVYSTYLGGVDDNECLGIAVDSSGNAYITGYTFSWDFPTTPGVFGSSLNGGWDSFVTKLNPSALWRGVQR